MRQLVRELQQRHVFRVAAAYAAVAFVAVQVADIAFPALNLPPWTLTLVVALAILCFPVALVLAWAYDITPAGIRRTERGALDWSRVHELFNAALELEPGERRLFLRRETAGEPRLHREVQALLIAHAHPGPLDRLGDEVVSPVLEELRGRDAAPPAQPDPNPPPVAGSRYELLEKVDEGGMGIVYRARDERLGRTVALKFLPRRLARDAAAQQRFLLEARAAAALDHPNICTIHEVGEAEDGHFFIAMPFYAGESLRARIARGPLPVEEALDLALQAAHGLGKAHEHGIVHRDIKPANLLVTADGVLKIVDFGIAKSGDMGLTRPGTTIGTVAYMSPEQASGEALDLRSDLWSLGVVLFEMLIGRHPFEGGSEREVLRAIREAAPPAPSSLRPEASSAVDAVVARALAKRPEQRFATAADFARALQAARAGREPASTATREPERAAAGLPAEGERRQASILVCSITGFPLMAERLPPTQLEVAIRTVREAAEAVADGHGGVLDRFEAEHFVLLFGLLASHEDDAPRAVRAALELRRRIGEIGGELDRRLGEPLGMRAGIGTGLLIVHPLRGGSGGNGGWRVTGESVRVAERLAERAEAGEVLVSPESGRMLAGFFDLEAAPALEWGSGAGRITPHRVLGECTLQSRLEAAGPGGLTPYAGREDELELLRSALRGTCGGEGRLVVVLGESGAGKSRLLYEFRRGLEPGSVRLLVGRCQAKENGPMPYRPFLEVVKSLLDLPAPAEALPDASAVVARLLDAAPELEPFVPLCLHLLGIQDPQYPLPKQLEGEQFRLALVEAIAALLTLAARRTPIVLLLEDWHWADDASRQVLKQLAEIVAAHPLLIAVSSRPEESTAWADPRHHVVHLRPLGREATLAIVAAVLKAERVEEELARLVHERTGGNPFFIEEVCHALREERLVALAGTTARLVRAIDVLHLPETVQAVIRSRLDRTDPTARELLRLAAVIGREFSRDLLARAAGDPPDLAAAIERLKDLDLVQQVRVFPDAAFRFKHALTADVAYESLLEHQRSGLHARVGAVIERLYEGQLEQHLDALVHHFSRARDWRRAVGYGLRAADRAATLNEFAEELALLERVESWLLEQEEDAARAGELLEVLLRQERVCEHLGQRGRQQRLIDRMRALLDAAPAPARAAEVYLREGELHTLLRGFATAEVALDGALRLSREASDPVGERRALSSLGLLRWHEGRSKEAVTLLERALRIDRERGELEAVVGDLVNLAGVLKAGGQYDAARRYLQEALALTGEVEVPIKRCSVLHYLANLARIDGDLEQALGYLHEAVELTRHWPVAIHSFHLTSIAHIYLQQGRIEESVASYGEAVEASRRANHAAGLAQSLRVLGEVLAELGRAAEAVPHLEEALGLYEQLEDHEAELQVRRRLAARYEADGDPARAAECWRRARDHCHGGGDAPGELEALEGLARTARRRGDVEEASEHLQAALALAERLGHRQRQGSLLSSLGLLEWERGRYEEALAHYEGALARFEALGERANAGVVLNSLGATLNRLDRPVEALRRVEQAISLHLQTGQRLPEAHALAAAGEAYARLGKPELALRSYHESLDVRRELGDVAGQGWMLLRIAELRAADAGSGEGAEQFLDQAAAIARQSDDAELAAACARLRVQAR